MSVAVVRGMKALGDCLFQRPYVRELAKEHDEVYLGTPWPQLYSDIENVRPCRVETRRVVSRKNSSHYVGPWHEMPEKADRVVKVHNADGSPIRIGESFGSPILMPPECPDIPTIASPAGKPIAVVRPPAKRLDWDTENREPHSFHIFEAAEELYASHHVALVGGPSEEVIGRVPPHHANHLDGNLSFEAFMVLVASADVIVAGVGSMVPLAIALQKKALVVVGGRGATCGVGSVCHSDWKHKITFVHPDPYCYECADPRHRCNKLVPDFRGKLRDWLYS